MKYADKLKDPRWQKKRLETLEKHKWNCDFCLKEDKELHVHHDWYDGEPWDVPDDALFVLCSLCHEAIHCLTFKKGAKFSSKRMITLFYSIKLTDDWKEFVDILTATRFMIEENYRKKLAKEKAANVNNE